MVLGFDVALTVRKHPSTSCNGFKDGSDDGMLNWIAWLAAKVCRCPLHSPRRGRNSLSECLHLAHPRTSPKQLISGEVPPQMGVTLRLQFGPASTDRNTSGFPNRSSFFLCSTLGARMSEASGCWRWANIRTTKCRVGNTLSWRT